MKKGSRRMQHVNHSGGINYGPNYNLHWVSPKGPELAISIQIISAKITQINHTINFRNGIKRTSSWIRWSYYGKIIEQGLRYGEFQGRWNLNKAMRISMIMKATFEQHLKDSQREYPGPKGCHWLVCSSNIARKLMASTEEWQREREEWIRSER